MTPEPEPEPQATPEPEPSATPSLGPDTPIYEDDPSPPAAGSFAYASITGMVTDEDGQPLARAQILTNPAPAIEIAPIETGSAGHFDLGRYLLPPGRYTITARLAGYEDASMEVDATNGPVRVDLKLLRES